MLVVVGSTNPVKIAAVEAVFKKVWKDAAFRSLEVTSGVSCQPIGFSETIRGALNRAKRALKSDKNADFGVGLEGGVRKLGKYGVVEIPWACIISKDGRMGIGSGPGLILPKKIGEKVLNRVEFGDLLDEITGITDVRKKMGGFGIFTNGLVDRKMAYEVMVASALARFVGEKYYK